ncbi:type II CRISPR-associated endonuclease Cas1 [Propionivibrio limicola]|uniref:type II CRISPR-associated endonuclease Cas1 n=1 Tax=Propionivibrio limicola TaxID=167645 RepID=UPI00129122AB|nr:type II CRISPR-associated endonuclease Cas1 [Propionivibrio limicola]
MISRPARLRREHFSLAIEQEETAFIPFEDIAVIVLNHRQINLTHPVLSACAEYGIGLYATGDNHQPNGIFLPFLSHSRTTRLMRKQLDVSKPLAKQAWANIVRRKIENQAACLRLAARQGADRLSSYANRVRSGDVDNIEGQAAAFYFAQLFGPGFYRAEERWINAALDYGYAVLRGAIARGLVAHGLHPPLGIFHASEQNAFNLADDLIEPFRPVVDLHVAKNPPSTEGDLSPKDKADLVALLNVDLAMPQGKMSVMSAIEYAVESLGRLFEQEDSHLELPSLIGLRTHTLDY